MPRLPRPRLPRPRLSRPNLPRPSQALLDLARVAGDVARDGWDLWLGVSIYTRRRLGVAGGLLALIALIWLVAVPALPCQAPGGSACAPSDHAIGLVPDDALAYAHLNLEPANGQFDRAESIASRVPTLARQVTGRLVSRLPGPHGASPDFDRDIEPWFGGEAALAILPAGQRAAQQVQLLQASDQKGAREFAASIASGRPRTSSYRGVDVRVDAQGLATALLGGFLAIGTKGGVDEVIAAQRGADGAHSLADDPAAGDARDALPDQRLADLYLSERGIVRLVAGAGSPLATATSVIDPGASRGAAAALVASDDGLELTVRSRLDPARVRAHPGFFSAFPAFQPTLPASLPADSLGYLGIGQPGRTIGSLLEQAGAQEPGLAAAVGRLTKRLRSLGDVDLERQLLPSLGGEAALALEPSPRGGSRTPALIFVGSGIDPALAGQALARLQGPVAKALGSSRQAPVFGQRRMGEVTAHTLRLSPTIDLTYAIVGKSLVIATNPAGVRAVSVEGPSLDRAALFQQATAGLPGQVAALGYLNLDGLVALGERAGLTSDSAYRTFAPEIRKLKALALAVHASPEELSTDVRLVVGG